MRLDKYLSETGYGTRNEVKKLIKQKVVYVNGSLCLKADQKVNEETDSIVVEGMEVVYKRYAYYMLNKPSGYISATEANVPTVLDLIYEVDKHLFPCGRLDKDTEGLLLITNDGDLSHRLLSPKNGIEKEYYVECRDEISDKQVELIEKGIVLETESYKPAHIQKREGKHCHILLTEGKYHEIKRMFLAVNNEVTYLKRVRMHTLKLDESLASGEYRELSEAELEALKAI
ncbi:MAG: rRNA pseudouridine synthase [Solobacterium sp.]|nr:rRNA pseudouridine synthase [Solobacterium sp.]